MTRATIALAALHQAIADNPPPCRGDDRYIDDDANVSPELQLTCSTCFAFQECRAYALIARPKAGVWAGEKWNQKRKPGRPRKDAS